MKKGVVKGITFPVAVGDALTREEGQVVRMGDEDEEESESEEEDEELFFSDYSSMGPELTTSQADLEDFFSDLFEKLLILNLQYRLQDLLDLQSDQVLNFHQE